MDPKQNLPPFTTDKLNMSKPKIQLPNWPHAPAMVPFAVTLRDGGRPVTSYEFGMRGDPKKNFEEYARGPLSDLDARAIGNGQDLAQVHLNAFAAEHLLRKLAEEVDARGLPRDERANNAGANILLASTMLGSALILSMRSNWHHHAALSLCRTAIELTVKGGMLAVTTGDESARWYNGPRLPTPEEQRAAEFPATHCCQMIVPLVRRANPSADPPEAVYSWLCRYTHFDALAIEKPIAHEASYAAIAYVGWLAAVVAEEIAGVPIATWPSRWPSPLPWK